MIIYAGAINLYPLLPMSFLPDLVKVYFSAYAQAASAVSLNENLAGSQILASAVAA
jgi:hypothetical protein